MIRNSARGSLILMMGQVVAAIISAVTLIWIANALGAQAYGQYTVVLVPVSLALLFQDLGMNMSLTRYCAMYRHDEQQEKLKSVVMTGLIFSIVISLIINALMYIFAGPIASIFLKHPEVEPLVKAASFTVLGSGALVSTIQAIFVGYEIMTVRSLLQVIWTVLRTIFSLLLILSGFGAFGAVLAYSSSYIVTGIVGTLLLFVIIKFEPNSTSKFNFGMLKMFIRYGLPLTLSTLIGGISAQIYNYIMILYVSLALIGNYGAASNFAVLISFITVPISTTLFPLYSKFKRDDPQVKEIFHMSVKYTSMVTLPVTLAIVILSNPVSSILYRTQDYPYVPLYLSVFILNFAWEGLGGVSLWNLISGVGESGVIFRSSIITFITGLILVVILVPTYGMIGLLVTIVLDSRGGWIYQILWAKRKLNITVDWDSTVRIYAVGFLAAAATYLLISLLQLHGWIALISGGVTYLVVYAAGLPISGALRLKDFKQLETIMGAMGPLAPIVKQILSLLRRLIKD